MEISTATWMMVAFITALIFTIWKIYPFLINQTLEDDDTKEDSYDYLIEHMHKVLKDLEETPDEKALYKLMISHKDFNKERFWRFNLNKLKQLLFRYYGENPHLNSLKHIHQAVQERD